VNDAALNLVRRAMPVTRCSWSTLGDDYYLDQDFTDNVAKLRAALERVDTREARRCTTPSWHRPRTLGGKREFRSEFFWW